MENNPEVIEVDVFTWQVPECCREGWDSCRHCLPKDRVKQKRNIGL